MIADSDIQVWLDTQGRVQPRTIVPYVVSQQAQELRYRVRTVQEGNGGRSVIGQSGAVTLTENSPAALSRIALSQQPGARCEIEVVVTGADKKAQRFLFECPP